LFIAWKISGIIGNKYGDMGDVLQPVGTIRSDYHLEENCYELSWTVAPEARGRGTGKWMVAILANQLHDKNIRAEVKSENIGSIKIAEYAGMKLQGMDFDDICYYYRKAKHD